jgi:bacillithiol biosynthesis cysteine-adding enzyme BshC
VEPSSVQSSQAASGASAPPDGDVTASVCARLVEAVGAVARRPSDALLEALEAQHEALGPSPARERHLEALRAGQAAVVVTGQQVGLFGGPLYTLHKAATAIRLARELTARSGHPVVPLFWLQTEDHDIDEVDHCALYRPPEHPLRVSLPPRSQTRLSLSEQPLGPGVEVCLEAIAELVSGEAHAAEALAALRHAYRPQHSFARAFAALLGGLFAEQGLLLIDPRDARVAAAAAPLHRRALAESAPIAEAMLARGAELRAQGQATPVHVRPGAPLAFFHPAGADGPRYRLDRCEGGYRVVGAEGEAALIDEQQLLEAHAADPRVLSTSALLRPVLQDALLPVVATVGGPSEVAYFAQLPPLYQLLDVRPSLPLRRASLRLIDPRLRRRLEALGLGAEEVQRLGSGDGDGGALRRELAERLDRDGDAPTPEGLSERLLAPLSRELEAFGPIAAALDPKLSANVDKTRVAAERAVSKLVEGYRRALLRDDQVVAERCRYAQQALMPGGVPQERVYALPTALAQVGAERLVRGLLDAISDPFSGITRDLEL